MLLPLQILVNLRGITGASAALSWTESNDVSAVTVNLSQSIALAWTEANDGAAVNVSLLATASLAWTEADDTAAINATITDVVSVSWVETNDTASITASLSQATSLAWTEANDGAAITVSVAVPVSASLAWTEDNDATAITGTSAAKKPSEGSYGKSFKRTSWMRKRKKLQIAEPVALEVIETVAQAFSPPERLDTFVSAVAEMNRQLSALDIQIKKDHAALLELELMRLIEEEDDEFLLLL